MTEYSVVLESPVSRSFRCQKAADSLDIDAQKKARHELTIEADLETDYTVGLIVEASGSGKTTLAQQIWSPDLFEDVLDPSKPILD